MPLTDYQIIVFDWNGNTRRVYDGTGIYNLKYSRALNDVGSLALVVPHEDNIADDFDLDFFVEIQRRSPVSGRLVVEDTYLCRLNNSFREENDERFICGGLSLNHLLMRRLVDPDDDSGQAGGYSTKQGPADDIMVEYARQQCADLCLTAARKFPNFSVSGSLSLGTTVGRRLRHENLLDEFKSMAEQGGVDFNIRRVTGNTLLLDVAPIGSNKTKSVNYPSSPFVLLTPKRGNLTDPDLTLDRKDEKTFVYAKSQGQGSSRKVLKMGGPTIYDSPFNRIEFAYDGRNTEKTDPLTVLSDARSELNKYRPNTEFKYKPTGQEPGNTYEKDFDLGDKISVEWNGVEKDLRVVEVEITVSESGEDMDIKVGVINE